MPFSQYQTTVKLDGEWLVADFMKKNIGPNVASWICELKPNETCTIHLRRSRMRACSRSTASPE
jgi:hypothetical protein